MRDRNERNVEMAKLNAEEYKRKDLKENEKILDFMGSTELIANLLRISQTADFINMIIPFYKLY